MPDRWQGLQGDARSLPLPDASVDAVVCDPPYELGFMGRTWDRSGVAYQVETWAEALRVAKPGAHLVAFGGPRTHHRLMVGLEDADFSALPSLWCQAPCHSEARKLGKSRTAPALEGGAPRSEQRLCPGSGAARFAVPRNGGRQGARV